MTELCQVGNDFTPTYEAPRLLDLIRAINPVLLEADFEVNFISSSSFGQKTSILECPFAKGKGKSKGKGAVDNHHFQEFSSIRKG